MMTLETDAVVVARDTLIKYLEENFTFGVKTFKEAQQMLQRNALNVRFLDDISQVGSQVWATTVSLDLLVDNKADSTMFAERKAAMLQTQLVQILSAGLVSRLYRNGAWESTGYISWVPLSGLTFRNIPTDSYTHKNLTLRVSYFIKGG